jgi:hypothetical protein
MIRAQILELEHEQWTAEVGPDINEPAAENYRIAQANDGLSLVMCSSKAYSGWLAKQVSPLVLESARIKFHYAMMTDDATRICAQVAETDAKITDSQGWTYDLSAQWEMVKSAEGWMFQIDDADWKWTDAGIVIPAARAYDAQEFAIHYRLDYQQKASAIVSVEVDNEGFEVPESLWWIPARQAGWAPSQIVTQLQQCNRGEPGGYTLRFSNIGYLLEA